MDEIQKQIDTMVKNNKVVLFMKGTKEMPRCGFSAAVVECLNALEVPFETVDVLADEMIRNGIKTYSNWPTIPQLYVGGKFVGGCDIVREMYQTGDLKETLDKALS